MILQQLHSTLWKLLTQRKCHLDQIIRSTSVFWARLKFGLSAASSFRWTGSRREVKNVSHFSARNPSFVPTKTAFLWQTATKVLACYLTMGLGNNEKMNKTYFQSTKVPFSTRLTEISGAELGMRIGGTIGAGVGFTARKRVSKVPWHLLLSAWD